MVAVAKKAKHVCSGKGHVLPGKTEPLSEK